MADPSDPYGIGTLTPGIVGGGGGLLGGFNGFSPLTNFGLGLLAQSGPSLTPQSPWAAIGKAGQYTSQAEQQALENALYRQKILESAQEQQGLAKLQAYFNTPEGKAAFADNPTLAALLSSGVPDVLKGAAAAYADPTLVSRMALTNADLGTKVAANNQAYLQARGASKATEFLKSKGAPGEWILQHPILASWLQTGKSITDLAGLNTADAISAFPGLKGAKPEDIPKILAAAATVEGNRGKLLATGGLDPSVSGAPADVQLEAFRQAEESAKTVARAGGKLFDLGNVQEPTYAWDAGGNNAVAAAPPAPAAAGTTGYRPGAGIVNDAGGSVYTPLPPSAAAPIVPPVSQHPIIDAFRKSRDAVSEYVYGKEPPANPLPPPAPSSTPRKVPTLQYDPQGRPTFRSKAEFDRAVKNGSLSTSLPEGGYVVIGGTVYPVTRGAGGPAGG